MTYNLLMKKLEMVLDNQKAILIAWDGNIITYRNIKMIKMYYKINALFVDYNLNNKIKNYDKCIIKIISARDLKEFIKNFNSFFLMRICECFMFIILIFNFLM